MYDNCVLYDEPLYRCLHERSLAPRILHLTSMATVSISLSLPHSSSTINFQRAFLLFLLLSRLHAQPWLPPDVLDIIEEKEAFVRQLADEAAALFRKRGALKTPCDCSIHVCRTGFSQHACGLIELNQLCGISNCQRPEGAVTFVETPPDVDTHSVSNEMEENICLYKSMESVLTKLDPLAETTTRISTKDGHSRVYPGLKLRANLDEREELTGKECGAFDPRGRAFYVGASVGPKDVVFVIDASKEMGQLWRQSSNDSRLTSIESAIQKLLDGFSAMDRINVVAYSDKARRRGVGIPLYSATTHEVKLMKQTIGSLRPLGQGRLRSGLRLAFQLLTTSSLRRLRYDDFHRGQKVMVVITGSSNHGIEKDDPPLTSTLLMKLRKWQSKLEGITGTRASIFTYSIGDDVDHSLLQQIACANNGAWFSIGPDDDAYRILNTYNAFLASTHGARYPIWTNFRRDPINKILVTTVAKAFHFEPESGIQPLLLGVVSHDVQLKDLMIEDVPQSEIEAELIRRSRRHDAARATPCRLQVQRNVYANASICIDTLPIGRRRRKKRRRTKEHPPCFESQGLLCKTFLRKLDWKHAASSCEIDGGSLANFQSFNQLAFLSSIASVDGSWIDAPLGQKPIEGASIDMKIRMRKNKTGCLILNNNGIVERMKTVSCTQRLSYICTYPERRRCQRVISLSKRGYFTHPPLNLCIKEEEALANAGALPTATGLPSSHLWCSLDHGERDLRSLCCRGCPEEAMGSVEADEVVAGLLDDI